MSDLSEADEVTAARAQRVGPRLSLVYAVRAVAALAWIAALFLSQPTFGDSSPSLDLRLLVALYPLIDALACLVDLRLDRSLTNQLGHGIEMTISFVAAAWIATIGQTWDGTIALVGYWAVATGAVQLIVALQRVQRLRGQWFMVISGAGSVAAGFSFTTWHGDGDASVALITQYAAGGLLWYLVAAVWAIARRGARRPVSEAA
jgi:hypothetical protein